MTALEALHAVYARGVECEDCSHCFYRTEHERLSGRATAVQTVRCCSIIESQNYRFAREAIECHGVEDELARNEDE